MSSYNLQVLVEENELQMEIWDYPYRPGFMFQQYRALDESKTFAYEALAILKNADGSPLPNAVFFDQLRNMDEAWHIEVDRFLVPLAIIAAAEKKRLPVAVNVHLATACDAKFIKLVTEVIKQSGLKQSDVLFEIVEPHVPTRDQVRCLEKISARLVGPEGFTLIIDDHDFETGEERLQNLAPVCDMVKIDMKDTKPGIDLIKSQYPHLSVVVERVTFNDRDNVFALYPSVFVQGI